MDTLISMNSANQNKDIYADVNMIDTIADVFLNTHDAENAVLLRHFGNELKQFHARLQNKLYDVTHTLEQIEYKLENVSHSDVNVVKQLISSLTPETSINRAESNLHEESFCFVPISSRDMYERINIKDDVLSPVICLWEESLNESKGKVQTALRRFVNRIEKTNGEFTDILMDVSSSIKHFDESVSVDNLKTLGQWRSKLTEMNSDNLKATETAIALASYILGDNNVYTQSQIVGEIQKRHNNYLENL